MGDFKMEYEEQKPEVQFSQKKIIYSSLSTLESSLYIIIWVAAHIWSISSVFYISEEKVTKYHNNGYLEIGWVHYIGRYKDTTDFEWSFWNKFFLETVVIGFTGHFFIARIADIFCPNVRYEVFLAYSMLFTAKFLGVHGLLFMVTHFAIQYAVAWITKDVMVCWITGLGLVYTLANKNCVSYIQSYYEDEDKGFFLLFSTAMCNLRYIGFSIDYVWSLNKANESGISSGQDTNDSPKSKLQVRKPESKCNVSDITEERHKIESVTYTFLDLLIYQMYFPLFFGGPIITYNEFAIQVQRPPRVWNWSKIFEFFFGIVRYFCWQLFAEFTLHFMYFGAMQTDYPLLHRTPLRAICGLSLCHVYFFYLKYLIMYGMPAHFATSDNLAAPGPPHCVGSRHRVTDMWRYFDKGLHKWLVRYIYLPCKGDNPNFMRQTISSILPFAFTCFWHGFHGSQICWASLSWFGVYGEMVMVKLYTMKQVQDFEQKYLTPQWSRRIQALLSSIMFGYLIVSNLYFLNGRFVANLHVKRLYTENLLCTIIIHLLLTCGVHTSMDLEIIGYKTTKMKKG